MADGKKISELTESATIEDAQFFAVSDGTDTKKVAYSTIKNDLIDYSEELAEVISPTITSSEIDGGHRLTIEDYNGTSTVNVMDGETGPRGPQGIPGPQGETGTFEDLTTAQVQELASYVVDDACIRAFDTVADMQAAVDLKAGMVCHTSGFHASGDGGAAYYTVSSTGTANGMDVLACANSLKATLVVTEPYVMPEQFGAYGDETHDDSAVFAYVLDNYSTKSVHLGAKVYLFGAAIELEQTDYKKINMVGVAERSHLLAPTEYQRKYSVIKLNKCAFIEGNGAQLTGNIRNITFFGTQDDAEHVLSNLQANMLVFSGCSVRYVNTVFHDVQIYTTSNICYCTFYNVKTLLRGSLVDSCISNNYISGNGTSDAYCFVLTEFNASYFANNFVDYFKCVFTGYVNSVVSVCNVYELVGNVIDSTLSTAASNGVGFSSSNDSFDGMTISYLTSAAPNLVPSNEGVVVVTSNCTVNFSSPKLLTNRCAVLLSDANGTAFYPGYARSSVQISDVFTPTQQLTIDKVINISHPYQLANTTHRFWIDIDLPPEKVDALPAATDANMWNGHKVIYNGELYMFVYGWKQLS